MKRRTSHPFKESSRKRGPDLLSKPDITNWNHTRVEKSPKWAGGEVPNPHYDDMRCRGIVVRGVRVGFKQLGSYLSDAT
jgi:hypothetical protein